jgi:putative zinc finger protein
MYRCEDWQDKLLDYLYGALEPKEESAVRDHVRLCAACTSALAEAEKDKLLLARAAQVYRSLPPFAAPAEEAASAAPAGAVPETTLPMPVRSPMRPGRWMFAAAAVLLAIVGLTVWHQSGLGERRAGLALARRHFEDIDARLAQAPQKLAKEQKRLQEKIEKQFLHVQVVGPARYHADAPSPLRISTHDLEGKPRPARVSVAMVAKNREVFRDQKECRGDLDIFLPAGLTTAGGTAKLMVEARTEEATARLTEEIRLEAPDYITHLAVNQLVFQGGETLRFRTMTLQAFDQKPARAEIELSYKLMDARNQVVRQLETRTGSGGVAGGQWDLPRDMPEGSYTLRVEALGPNVKMAGRESRLIIRKAGAAPAKQPADERRTAEMFPEGGDLVAGVPNRVYFRVRPGMAAGRMLRGDLAVVSGNQVLAESRWNSDGLGVLSFTPQAGQRYGVRLNTIQGVTNIPDAFRNIEIRGGVALSVPESVQLEGKPVALVLHNPAGETRVLITATCRGRLVAQEFVTVRPGKNNVTLALAPGTRGVVRVTVAGLFGPNAVPIAERLIYRVPALQLRVTVNDGKPVIVRAGNPLALELQSKSDKGDHLSAWALAAIVHRKALTGLSTAQTPAVFFMSPEVPAPEDLDDAGLLVSDQSSAWPNLDLFLGTHGWRRFVPATPAAVAMNRPNVSFSALVFSRENAGLRSLWQQKVMRQHKEEAILTMTFVKQQLDLEKEREEAVRAARQAAADLAVFENRPAVWLRLGAGIAVVLLLTAGALCLAAGLVRSARRAGSPTAAFGAAFTAILVGMILYGVGTFLPEPNPRAEQDLMAWLPDARHHGPVTPQGAPPPTAPATGDGILGQFAVWTGSPREESAQARLQKLLARADSDAGPGFKAGPMAMMKAAPSFSATAKATEKKGTAPQVPFEAKTLSTPVMRSYAHMNSKDAPKFVATILWEPGLFLAGGKGAVNFDVPPQPADYYLWILGHSADGRLGWFHRPLRAR